MKTLFVGMILLTVPGMVCAADIEASRVLLRGVDKITGRTQMSEVDIGSKSQFGALVISAEKCLKRPPEETPENAAFLKISEVGLNGAETVVFNGWMFSSNPALSAMEHPVYDIWVVDCIAPQTPPAWEVNAEKITLPSIPQQAVDIETLPALNEGASWPQPDFMD